MSIDSRRPPPFYCPACGQKHRADLSALQGHAGASARVPCTRCEVVMALHIGTDGLPKCEMNEPLGAAMSQPDAKKPSLLLPLAAAVLAAAAVSFAVVSAMRPEAPSQAKADPRIAVLEKTVKDLQAKLGELTTTTEHRAQANAEAVTALQQGRSGSEGAVAALGETMSALEGQQAKLATTFLALQSTAKSLNGRIESNYTTLRGHAKRLKVVEAR